MTEAELGTYLRALVAMPRVRGLWGVKDRGMPVFAHTVDVTLLCLEAFPVWRAQYPGMDLAALVVGGMLHDLTKLATHQSAGRSHSQIMRSHPGIAVDAATGLLDEIERKHGLTLGASRVEQVRHIVASHHGVWGKVPPRTPEALLVHRCDLYSASHHRISPIDANDILPLLSQGYRWPLVSARLGVSRAIVKARLQESCRVEQVREWVDLLEIWRARGRVCPGTPDRVRQLERARLILTLARQVPESILEQIHPLFAEPDLSLAGVAAVALPPAREICR